MATPINPPANSTYKDYDIASLEGPILDLAVANTLGIQVTTNLPTGQSPISGVKYYTIGTNGLPQAPFAPSSLWEQGGPLLDQYRISVYDKIKAWASTIRVGVMLLSTEGKTYLSAGMHAPVSSTYGTTINM
jgi:hypothetical protein